MRLRNFEGRLGRRKKVIYSITSSARSKIDGGTPSPSSLAVFAVEELEAHFTIRDCASRREMALAA
jgi:hypothetical protein